MMSPSSRRSRADRASVHSTRHGADCGLRRAWRLALIALAIAIAPASAEIIEQVVAKVNGDMITLSEYQARQLAAVQAARIPPEQVERFLRDNNARILQEAVDEILLVQRAGDLGIRMRAEIVREYIDGIKKENNIESDAALAEQLEKEGMSVDELKRNIERSILRSEVLRREVQSKLGVSEADARAHYEQDRASYTTPATVHLQEILIKSDAGGLAGAREVAQRIRAGEDFATLARQHSAAASRAAGGDLGRVAPSDLAPAVAKVANSLAPGAVSEPIATADGYLLLKVVDRRESTTTPFDQVKTEILRLLQQKRTQEQYEQYLEGLRKRATVDYRVREVPLSVSGPVGTGNILGSLPADGEAEPKPVATPQPAPADVAVPDVPEIATTPQAQPEKVAPAPLPETSPRPQPTPSPKP